MKQSIVTLSLILILFGCETFGSKKIAHYEKYKPTPVLTKKVDKVDFYSRRDAFGEFSNFALFPIEIDGVMWPTSEHYYQAYKYNEPELREWVRAAKKPYEAAQRGRDKSKPKRKDWKQAKDAIMEKALVAKFSQYPQLQELLLSTGDAVLYEHTKNDCYWGDCGNRKGKNKLGKALMAIRKRLKNGTL